MIKQVMIHESNPHKTWSPVWSMNDMPNHQIMVRSQINQIRIFQTMLLIHTTPSKDQARPAGNGVKASWLLCGYVAWHQHFACGVDRLTGWPHQNREVNMVELVGGLGHFLIYPYIGNGIIPTD
jgi:hypothetical protein